MNLLILLFFSIVVLTTARLGRISRVRIWRTYKAQFGKMYLSNEHERKSQQIFFQNARAVRLHNLAYLRGKVTYKKTLNHLSDRLNEDVIGTLTGLKVGPIRHENKLGATKTSTTALPSQYNGCPGNWTVRDQGQCGSCWAFSTMGSIEGANYQKTGGLLDLSEQQLTDCVYPGAGCNGGWMPDAYDYLKNNRGTCNESDYPYTANGNGTCQAAQYPRSIQLNSNTSYYQVASDDTSLKTALMSKGPIATAVDASDWNMYGGGVYKNTARNWEANHAVILCGWGTSNGLPYWIIRNSWSASWGLSGYIWVSAQRSGNSYVTNGGLFTNYCFTPSIQ